MAFLETAKIHKQHKNINLILKGKLSPSADILKPENANHQQVHLLAIQKTRPFKSITFQNTHLISKSVGNERCNAFPYLGGSKDCITANVISSI